MQHACVTRGRLSCPLKRPACRQLLVAQQLAWRGWPACLSSWRNDVQHASASQDIWLFASLFWKSVEDEQGLVHALARFLINNVCLDTRTHTHNTHPHTTQKLDTQTPIHHTLIPHTHRRTHTHTHTHTHSHTVTHSPLHIHTRTNESLHTHTYTQIRKIHKRTHTHIHTDTQAPLKHTATQTYRQTHTHTHTHRDIHTHIHTPTPTHTPTPSRVQRGYWEARRSREGSNGAMFPN